MTDLKAKQTWRERVAQVEARLRAAEQKRAEDNAKIETRTQQAVAKVRERTTYVRHYVDREVVKYDDSCKIPDVVVKAHNAAAKNEEIK